MTQRNESLVPPRSSEKSIACEVMLNLDPKEWKQESTALFMVKVWSQTWPVLRMWDVDSRKVDRHTVKWWAGVMPLEAIV